jgi:hypothetical protein
MSWSLFGLEEGEGERGEREGVRKGFEGAREGVRMTGAGRQAQRGGEACLYQCARQSYTCCKEEA